MLSSEKVIRAPESVSMTSSLAAEVTIEPLTVVVDTVVFVRALINPHSRSGRLLLTDPSERCTIVLSPAVIEEILDVIFRPLLRRRFPQMAAPPNLSYG
jgi:hypothetical protein